MHDRHSQVTPRTAQDEAPLSERFFMKVADIKRNAFRSALVLHFVGLALSLGTRFADFAIDRNTANGSLQVLSFGRDLTSKLAFGLVLPGFLLMVLTGIVMVVLRYGLHPPFWIWIK